MSKIFSAIHEIRTIEELARRDQWVNKLHPLVKFIIVMLFLVKQMSVSPYDFVSLLYMILLVYGFFLMADLSVLGALRRVWYVLPLLLISGIANPVINQQPMFYVGSFLVTKGLVSLVTLMTKGLLAVLMSYFLIATTTMEDLAAALSAIKVPKTFILLLLFIYRYLFLLLEETREILAAYQIRSGGGRKIPYSIWGSLVGLLLLRTIKRGEECYQSMQLRGFSGEFYSSRNLKLKKLDILCLGLYFLLLYIITYLPFLRFFQQ